MPEEYISYEQVRTGAKEISQCADRMQDIFDSVAGSVKVMTTDENFKGKASNALTSEFEPFRAKFADYVSAVRRFAALFESATSKLEANEASIQRDIQEL